MSRIIRAITGVIAARAIMTDRAATIMVNRLTNIPTMNPIRDIRPLISPMSPP
jgi:hypothetical protein